MVQRPRAEPAIEKGMFMDRKAIADWEREFRKQRGLASDAPVPVSLPSPTYGQRARRAAEAEPRRVRPVNVSQYATVNGPVNEKYVLEDGKYRLNPNFNPPFDITLGQAMAIPPLIGAAAGTTAALLPPAVLGGLAAGGRVIGTATKEGARLLGRLASKFAQAPGAGSRVKTAAKAAVRLQGSYPPKVAEALSEPYPTRRMGEHVIPRRWAKQFPFLAPVIKHEVNILRRPTKGEMYELHFKCDKKFNGTGLPRGLEQRGWSGAKAGLEKYGPAGWAWNCTTPVMKAGSALAVSAGGLGVNSASRTDARANRDSDRSGRYPRKD